MTVDVTVVPVEDAATSDVSTPNPSSFDVLSSKASLRPDPFSTDAAMAQIVRQRYPRLFAHTCKNDRGPTFAAVIADTSIPHLLEHLIIDMQVEHPSSKSTSTFVGNTEWIDGAAGCARIQVSFVDDRVALEALNQAIDALDDIISERNGCR